MPRNRRPTLLATFSLLAALGAGVSACRDSGSDASSTPISDASESSPSEAAGTTQPSGAGALDATLPLLNGEPQKLSAYKGKVILVVNTATECGYTPQFVGLESLYKKRGGKDFVILGFPADDVANQEPRNDAEIAEFCEANFGVTFPMFAKSNVVEDPNPVFAVLGETLGAPTWNFNKYLLDRNGNPVERFDQNTVPDDPALTAAIDTQIAQQR